jgi:hypothetical protein
MYHKPIGGLTPMEAQAKLAAKVRRMDKHYKKAMREWRREIERLRHLPRYHSAYYKEVKTETGWSSVDSTGFTITHIPRHSRSGHAIELKLHLAYGNTTNSGLQESVFVASDHELADKIVTASQGSWQGLATYQRAPLPSEPNPNGFSLGVSSSGSLHWYRNTTNRKQLANDCVRDSLGITGVIVSGKVVTDPDMWGEDDTKKARICIGQNYHTKEIVVLTVGDHDAVNSIVNGSEYGMSPSEAARIMSGYCDMAVTVSVGGGNTGVAALDKGEMMFKPSNDAPQENTAFWYVSKSCEYGADGRTWELAHLVQLYGQLKYYHDLQIMGLDHLVDRLVHVEELIGVLETTVLEDHEQIIEMKGWIDNLVDTVLEYSNTVARLGIKVNELTATVDAMGTHITELNTRVLQFNETIIAIQSEMTEIKSQWMTIHQDFQDLYDYIHNLDIDTLGQTVVDLQAALQQEIQDRGDGDGQLMTQIGNLTDEMLEGFDELRDSIAGIEQRCRNYTDDSVSGEVTQRVAGDNYLQTQVNNTYNTLSAVIAQETANREESEADIRDSFSVLLESESTARQEQDEYEIEAREAGDNNLQQNIDNEHTERMQADDDLGSRIDDEESSRESADSTLQSLIEQEVNSRSAAIIDVYADLDERVSGEAEARESADNALQDSIDSLEFTKLYVTNGGYPDPVTCKPSDALIVYQGNYPSTTTSYQNDYDRSHIMRIRQRPGLDQVWYEDTEPLFRGPHTFMIDGDRESVDFCGHTFTFAQLSATNFGVEVVLHDLTPVPANIMSADVVRYSATGTVGISAYPSSTELTIQLTSQMTAHQRAQATVISEWGGKFDIFELTFVQVNHGGVIRRMLSIQSVGYRDQWT